MNNDDLDLSKLLETPPPPVGGVARARRTVAQRRRHRRALIGTAVAFVLVAGGVGTVLGLNRTTEDTVLFSEQASNTSVVPTTVSTTTTTIPVDPHQKYVGVEHDDRGAGLPLGTSIQSWGVAASDYLPQAGRILYSWVRDDSGDMVWVERITKTPAANDGGPVRSKVLAVFDIPKPPTENYLCLGWCVKGSKIDTSLVGVINADQKVTAAWKVDATKLTFTSVSAADVKAYAAPDLLDLPARPELYDHITSVSSEDFYKISAQSGITSTGGGNPLFLFDSQENKDVAVATLDDGRKVHAVIDAQENGDFRTGVKYKGEVNMDVVVYTIDDPTKNDDAVIKAAWLLDKTKATYKSVSISDIDLN